MALVVFMRGVNVGTAKRFQPSLLAGELKHLGVSNLGAAGTFVVRGKIGQAALRAEFLRRLPFACDLMVCEGRDLLKLAAAEPFPESSNDPNLRRFVSILANRLPKPAHAALELSRRRAVASEPGRHIRKVRPVSLAAVRNLVAGAE